MGKNGKTPPDMTNQSRCSESEDVDSGPPWPVHIFLGWIPGISKLTQSTSEGTAPMVDNCTLVTRHDDLATKKSDPLVTLKLLAILGTSMQV